MKRVSINIVNWNGADFLIECIRSIKAQTYVDIEINIIDNNSSDRSVDLLRRECPEIPVVTNAENEGFSKAHNQAIRISSGEYILPLNFDIVLDTRFVEEMVEAIESFPDVGIVSGNLYAVEEEQRAEKIDSTGIIINGMFPGDRGQNEIDRGQYNKTEYIFGASGAAPLLSREMLEDIKLGGEFFDEDYYMYVEDVDLCWRAQLYGWKGVYTPRAIAYHRRGATRKNSSAMKRDYILIGHRNRYWTIIKNAILVNLSKNLFWVLMAELRFYIGHLLKGNYFIFRVVFMTLRGAPKMLRKRREIQKKRKVTADYMEGFFFGRGMARERIFRRLRKERQK